MYRNIYIIYINLYFLKANKQIKNKNPNQTKPNRCR